jgi:glycosyltransferase involved in cell wall biosynthesis
MVSEHASPLSGIGGEDAGGQNVHVDSLARQLAARGDSVVVHTRRDDARLPRRVPLGPGVWVDHVDAGPPIALAKDDLLPLMGEFAADLRRLWSAEPPDVVHAHFWMSALAAIDAASDLEIPVVVTFHALGVEKRRHLRGLDPSPPERVALESGIAESAHLVVATSEAEVLELAAMGAVTRQTVVIPCGVDVATFCPGGTRAARRGGLHRLVVAGRLVERKGIEDVIEALALLPGVELLVAGGSDRDELVHDANARRLVARARRAGVADRVQLLGRVPHRRMPPLLRSADVVVCAPWYEPFGMVAAEAMACGRPVVASSVGGLRETVVDGETGWLVAPHDPAAIAAAVRRCVDEPELAEAMGARGARRARSRYSWEQVADSTRSAYAELTQRTPIGRQP